jgi:hypothetical protein
MFFFTAKSPSDRAASKKLFSKNLVIIFNYLIVVRTTRADPRHHRKHRHQTSEPHFDDADERSHKDNLNSSPSMNGENKNTSQVNIYF